MKSSRMVAELESMSYEQVNRCIRLIKTEECPNDNPSCANGS